MKLNLNKLNRIIKISLFFLITIFYFVNYAEAKDISNALDPIIGSRTIKFVNKCPFPVWFGMISGATLNKSGNPGCTTDTDCQSGSVCVNRGAGGNHCFWKNPIPDNGQYQLAANGGFNSVSIPIYQNGLASAWSGAAAGRTNCASGVCETADCGTGVGGCPSGKGFMQPATQAEFTFNNNIKDFYDVTLVNGMNIPVEMGPDVNTAQLEKRCLGKSPCDKAYDCGNPGGVDPRTQVGVCTWNIIPPSNDYKWVAKGGPACESDSSCQAPATCGLSYDPTKTPKLQKTCGKLLGYWNANEACGKDNSLGAPFNCQQPLPAPDQNLKMTNLLGCSPVPSCYQNGAQSNCCGCVNWEQIGVPVPPAPYTEACKNSNSFWVSNVLPGLKWLKQACPTAYTYPFDDMSSTFTCQRMLNGLNSVNYVITFCPGGKTGGL